MIVYVTYTGTVGIGYDQTGVFGPANTSLSGDPYTVTYTFDTTKGVTYSSPGENYALGGYGSATGQPSPSLGAVVTINGHSVSIGGMDFGQIQAGAGRFVYDDARDYFIYNADTHLYNIVYNGILSPDGMIPPSITTPYTYIVTGSDQAYGLIQIQTHSNQNGDLILADGNLTPTSITVTTSALVMWDAVPDKQLTTLSGTAEANSQVSILDGNNLVGTVTAAANGTWSLQAKLTGNVDHSFTETSNGASSAGLTLYNPVANKVLTGGDGNDVLIAGRNDSLTGGAGSDTFMFNPDFGKVTVTDFNIGQDVLVLSHTLVANETGSQVLC